MLQTDVNLMNYDKNQAFVILYFYDLMQTVRITEISTGT